MTDREKTLLKWGVGIAVVALWLGRRSASAVNPDSGLLDDPKQLTPHFNLDEFTSHDGVEVPQQYWDNTRWLAQNLEVIREYFGNAAVTILSGYRSPAHNDAVEGADHSKHLTGEAADITVAGYTPNQVYDGILHLISTGELHNGGVGVYNGWVHYDVRKSPARWDKRT